METFHIRHRLPPKGGNNFSRSTRRRIPVTFCGAAVTSYDIGWQDKAAEFNGRVPCAECVARRAANAITRRGKGL